VATGIALSSFCQAKSLYVIDSLTITVRTGPSAEYEVIGMLRTGDSVDLKEQSGDWALVRYSGDQEGWVIARYLTETPPNALLLQQLQSEKRTDGELIVRLKEENSALARENEALAGKLTEAAHKFDELKQGAEGYLGLQEEYEATREKIQALLRSNEQLALENKVLKDVTKIKWFSIGAGVLLGGWVFGFILGRSSRKKKSGLTFSLKD